MNNNDELNRQRIFLAARLIFLAFGIGISCWAPMVPFVKRSIGLDDAGLGVLLLMFGIGALGTMPLSGWLVQRMGSRRLTLVSGMLMAMTLPFLTFVSSSIVMGFILFLFGATTGALNVSINSQAVEIEKNSQRVLMSGFHCFFSAGGLLGAVIVSALLEYGAPLPFCGVFVALIVACLILTQCKNLLPKSSDSAVVPIQQKFNFFDGKVLFLGFLCFIAFMSEGSMLDWSAEFLLSSLHYQPAAAGIGYALFALAMTFGRFFGDRAINRFGALTIFQAGSFIAASGFIMTVYIPATFGYVQLLGFIFIGLGASNIVPILFSAAGKVPSASSSQALSVITTIAYTGMLMGPAVIGFVAQAFTLSFAFTGIAFLLVAVGLCGKALEAPIVLQGV